MERSSSCSSDGEVDGRCGSSNCLSCTAPPLEREIREELKRCYFESASSSKYRTLESCKLQILDRVIGTLKLPFTSAEFKKELENRAVIEHSVLKELDRMWNEIMWAESKISPQDRSVYHAVVSNTYAQRKDLVQFVSVLVSKSTVARENGEKILKSVGINRILAVDGFAGLLPKHFKSYVENLYPRHDERVRRHVRGVRDMYDLVGDSVTGTTAACIVFLALSDLYLDRVKNRLEDAKRLVLDRTAKFVTRFLDSQRHFGEEIRAVDERRLRSAYEERVGDGHLQWIALEKLNEMASASFKLYNVK